MAAPSFDIVFLPERRAFTATGPVALYVAAAGAGILVEQPCGAQGTCGRCRVRVVEGSAAPSTADRDQLSREELADGWRLACQLVLSGPATIEVPSLTRSLAGKSFGDALPAEALSRPVVNPLCLTLPSPGDQRSSLDRLAAAMGRAPGSLRARPRPLQEFARALGVFRELFVAVEGDELLTARPGGYTPLLGLAVDIGTTSLAAALVRLHDGAVAASASRLNPQVAFGADVIARIQHATEHADGTARLAAAVRDGIQSLVHELLAQADCPSGDVIAAAVAGNPTMLHLWAGVDVRTLGTAPYAGLFGRGLRCKAADVGLGTHPNANVYVFPQVQSHVGGDAVAAAVACGLDRPGGARLLVDLGTNSEIVVACEGRLVATSAAAGPAFEGVSILHGMRAGPGAVDVVSLEDDGRVVLQTVAGAPARGICGSGLVDLVAGMLRVGLVTASGYLRRPDELRDAPATLFADRLIRVEAQQAFQLVAEPEEGRAAGRVVLTARDVRELQLAKGSIMTAASLACRHLGLDVNDLDEVLVAGAFGNYLRKSSAIAIGLVPPIDPRRIGLVGNAAGVGARLALIDREIRRRAGELADRAEYVELATRADYEPTFLQMLSFPSAG